MPPTTLDPEDLGLNAAQLSEQNKRVLEAQAKVLPPPPPLLGGGHPQQARARARVRGVCADITPPSRPRLP